MTSPLALTVEEVRDAALSAYLALDDWEAERITKSLNILQEAKRQSYMSTDRAREQYDDDLKVST